jgi:copper homeostasis protein
VDFPAETNPNIMEGFVIEIATADYETTRSAVEGGADRIELCAGLSEGGTTPSYGMIRKCREDFQVALFPIIRPRGGDFLYSPEEVKVMERDIIICRELGCDGIVTGLLLASGGLDLDNMERMVELAYPMEVTMHRAFDRCAHPFEVLEQLVSIGCQRILTSGQQKTAPEGKETIAALVKAADERIIIMPGSGVRADNICLLRKTTGAREFHSSLRGKRDSRMQFIHPAFEGSTESYSNPAIDPAEVRALRKALAE